MTQRNSGNKSTPLNLLVVGEMKEEWRQARKLRNEMYAQVFAYIAREVKELADLLVRFVKKGARQNPNVISVNR